MTTKYPTSDKETTTPTSNGGSGWARVVRQLMGIFGAIAAFMGLFIMFAGDNQSIGFWDSAWEVGEIHEWWGYGLLIGGGVVLAALIAWISSGRARRL